MKLIGRQGSSAMRGTASPRFRSLISHAMLRPIVRMVCNKMLFRRYRRLGKILRKKGIIPANRPGLR